MTAFTALSQVENNQSIFSQHFDRPKRILVIDDEMNVRLIAQCCLEDLNQWHVTATNRDEAVYQLKMADWDTILIETVSFEGIHSTIFEQLYTDATTRSIPILLLTTKVTAYDLAPFRRLSIAGVIAKPFDPVTLGWQIAHALGWTRTEDA
jgi:CheY-like chemotaxis protein